MLRNILILLCAATAAAFIWTSLRREDAAPDPVRVPRRGAEAAPLLDSGLTSLIRLPELSELERAHRPIDTFWLPDRSREADRIERVLSAEADARTVLTERFGPQIAQTPLFWQLFRPLNDRMPQLPSRQQIEIHELERQLVADSLRAELPVAFEAHLEHVRERLGEEVASEYALRASPLADELRRLDIGLSEAQFRRAYESLSSLNATTNRESFVAARRRLRELLGSRDFARLWSKRDPRFERIESAARRFDLTDETTLTAYAMLIDNQDAMLATAATADPGRRQQQLREQHDAGRRRLQELIGARAAEALLQASAGAPQ